MTATLAGAALAGPAAHAQKAEKYASIVVNAETGEVMEERFADAPRYPASLTKVMTLYMLFDAIKAGEISLDERMPVSANAASQPPSRLGLQAGSGLVVSDAIRAIVTKSANDVAVVIAERLGGSEERFAALMTVKARLLGLTDTRFYNSSGLPDDRQLTTARDMARLAEAMIEDHPDYYPYFSTERFTWGGKTYKSHNVLVGRVEGVDGLKTGYTRASGFNLMTSAERDGTRVIAVMLGGTTARARNEHVAELIEAAYVSLAAPADPTQPRRYLAFDTIDYTTQDIADLGLVSEGDGDGEGGS